MCNGLYRQGCDQKGDLFWLQVYQKVGFPLLKYCREICHFGRFKGPKELTDACHGCEKVDKTFMVLRFVHVLKTVHLQQF